MITIIGMKETMLQMHEVALLCEERMTPSKAQNALILV
jgi:hypothetical protein